MNENDQVPEISGSSTGANGAAPSNEGNSRSSLFNSVRQMFMHRSNDSRSYHSDSDDQEAATVQYNPADVKIIIIRNCSTKRVLQLLVCELGGDKNISGRYFVPDVQDLEHIKKFAGAHDLFVKESFVKGVLVLDLMVDRNKRAYPLHGGLPEDRDEI